MSSFHNIAPGTVVHYQTAQGQRASGRAVRMLIFPSHVVIVARGSRAGRPIVVTESNYVGHRNPREVRHG